MGEKVTVIVQLAPDAKLLPQVVPATAKSLVASPEYEPALPDTEMFVMPIGALPLLVSFGAPDVV